MRGRELTDTTSARGALTKALQRSEHGRFKGACAKTAFVIGGIKFENN
ncbi:MAG: hypothetical protein FWE74_01785 [Oscillospiraceae bacterium]|nr:hypothetical protein [Oscillospiraceae bacterium]